MSTKAEREAAATAEAEAAVAVVEADTVEDDAATIAAHIATLDEAQLREYRAYAFAAYTAANEALARI